jgi:hypothetical protein
MDQKKESRLCTAILPKEELWKHGTTRCRTFEINESTGDAQFPRAFEQYRSIQPTLLQE